MLSHLFALAKTRDEYLLIASLSAIPGALSFRSFADNAAEVFVRERLEEFRALPRTVDSYFDPDYPCSTGPTTPPIPPVLTSEL